MQKIRILLGVSALIFSSCFAKSSQTIGNLAVNLTAQLPPYAKMISGFAYIMGLTFVISGVLKMKQHKESPQSAPAMAGPVFIAMGLLLFYFPTTVGYLYGSVFTSQDSETGMGLYYSGTLMDGTSISSVRISG